MVLCMALIEEFIVVAVYEGIGLTLKKAHKTQHIDEAAQQTKSGDTAAPTQSRYAGAGQVPAGQPKKENAFLKVAKYTIIGRLVMAAMSRKN